MDGCAAPRVPTTPFDPALVPENGPAPQILPIVIDLGSGNKMGKGFPAIIRDFWDDGDPFGVIESPRLSGGLFSDRELFVRHGLFPHPTMTCNFPMLQT